MNRAARRQQAIVTRFGVENTADVYMAIKTAGDLADWELALQLAADHKVKTCIICLKDPIYSPTSNGTLIVKISDVKWDYKTNTRTSIETAWFRCCDKCREVLVRTGFVNRDRDVTGTLSNLRVYMHEDRVLPKRETIFEMVKDRLDVEKRPRWY